MRENRIRLNEIWTLFHETDRFKEEICKVKVIKSDDGFIVFESSVFYGWQPMTYSLLGAMIFADDFVLEKI